MNKLFISLLIVLVAQVNFFFGFSPYAKAAEIQDSEFLSGYRTGVLQAVEDIKNHREIDSASQSNISCQANWSSEFCTGYKPDTATKRLTRYHDFYFWC
jgi:hypothetical protein